MLAVSILAVTLVRRVVGVSTAPLVRSPPSTMTGRIDERALPPQAANVRAQAVTVASAP
ncbi:MAG: hypothetical protein R2749_09490 [Acidimicrobiales bacterium]